MTVLEIDTLRARRTALKAEIVRLNRTLKPYDADASALPPALQRWDFWRHDDVADSFATYLRARDVHGTFAPATAEALAAYTRAAFGRTTSLDKAFRARLDRGIAGRTFTDAVPPPAAREEEECPECGRVGMHNESCIGYFEAGVA